MHSIMLFVDSGPAILEIVFDLPTEQSSSGVAVQ
jgi:hypothetical protein